jgi:NAD(P)-dependent dehydrogenase (short-subunit alcohol dehydrogenase family)
LPVAAYNYETFTSTFEKIRAEWPDSAIRVGVFNAAVGVWKGFLDVTEAEIKESVDTNVVAAFAFSREAILAFKDQSENELGKRGTLIFTGATAALRGNKTTSAFAAGKFGQRALSQSLAKEFGPQGIHVAHVGQLLLMLTQANRFSMLRSFRLSSTVALRPTVQEGVQVQN